MTIPSRRLLLTLAFTLTASLTARAAISFPEETLDQWHGFAQHKFTVDGCPCFVVEPKTARAGQPWLWCMEFADAFSERCGEPALLEKGFHYAYMSVGNTFGSPPAVAHLQAFYEAVTGKGLSAKPALIGISRGGLYAYNWASLHPDHVSVIYGDAPVCDFKSWPGGKERGKGSAGDWKSLQALYGFASEAEALAYKKNPVDELAPLAQAKVPLIHVVGDADDVVPFAENTAVIAERYLALGGEMKVIHKPGVGHHPHGLDDPAPVVDFIVQHTPAN